MPPNHKSNQEARILQAIKAIHSNISSNIHAAARVYDVSRSTLTNRFCGKPIRQQSQIVNQKLFPTGEDVFFQWILRISKWGFLLRSSSVRKMADILFSTRIEFPVDKSPIISKN